MKLKFIAFCFFAACCLASCSNAPKENDEREVLVSRIASINKKMFDKKTMEFDKNLAEKGIAIYGDFAAKFPDDSLTAEYLFRRSDLQRAVGDNQSALKTLSGICNRYPDYKKVPECIFLEGYYSQEFFKDTVAAKQFYQELLSKYPNHPFADDAKALMKMFGKSEEDIIKDFEKKNQ